MRKVFIFSYKARNIEILLKIIISICCHIRLSEILKNIKTTNANHLLFENLFYVLRFELVMSQVGET